MRHDRQEDGADINWRFRQVIPSFTSYDAAVGQANATAPPLFDLGESVLSDLVLEAESVQL